MTPEAQRIAIAEACGWTEFHHDPEFDTLQGIPAHNKHIQMKHGWGMGSRSVPDYLNDLNAMHEAEKVLTLEQQHEYSIKLGQPYLSDRNDYWRAVHARAAQRAEAFLKTLGLWKEE